jgi:hypothetical protein
MPAAVEQFRVDVSYRERALAARPEDRQTQFYAAIGHNKLGTAMRITGSHADALMEFQEGRRLLTGLVAHDPTNLDWQRELGFSHVNTGRALVEVQGAPAALPVLSDGVRVLGDLVAVNADNVDWRLSLVAAHTAMSRALSMAGAPADALREAERAARGVLPLQTSAPADRLTARRAAEAALALAVASLIMGRDEDARAALAAASRAAQVFAERQDTDLVAVRAQLLALTGRGEEADLLFAQLAGRSYASRELEEARRLAARRYPGRRPA